MTLIRIITRILYHINSFSTAEIYFVGSCSAAAAMKAHTTAAWSGWANARQLSLTTTPKTTARWTAGLNVGMDR